ncbi:MAG: HEAT repeat domain-containing protein [Planctomycetes bacterium]|nr:HEAT repeat domain-containing protein [Planctomycetota bacterium]
MISTAAEPAVRLFNDEQMRQFVTHGYMALKCTLPREVHETIYKKFDELTLANGHVGNNILPSVPELQMVYDDPVIRGALTSVLGEGYVMHQHRYIHPNLPGSQGGGWHKDSYWGYTRKVRNHRPWWAMIMYYPQDTPLELGPTGVLKGRQHHMTLAKGDLDGALPVTGEAGTFFIIHYDIWHAANANKTQNRRYMSKFEFCRMESPEALGGPAWDCKDRAWHDPDVSDLPWKHCAQWRRVWDWAAGNKAGTSAGPAPTQPLAELIAQLGDAEPHRRSEAADMIGLIGSDAGKAVRKLIELLGDSSDPVGINAAYALASIGRKSVKPLIDALASESEPTRRYAMYALGAMGTPAASAVLDATTSAKSTVRAASAFILGELPGGKGKVTPALAKLAADEDVLTRHWAVEALGLRGKASTEAVPVLIDRLADADVDIAFSTAIALARIGPAAKEAVPSLAKCLAAENRYVRGHALEALHRIGTHEAIETAMHYLKYNRWCHTTTPANPFFP